MFDVAHVWNKAKHRFKSMNKVCGTMSLLQRAVATQTGRERAAALDRKESVRSTEEGRHPNTVGRQQKLGYISRVFQEQYGSPEPASELAAVGQQERSNA